MKIQSKLGISWAYYTNRGHIAINQSKCRFQLIPAWETRIRRSFCSKWPSYARDLEKQDFSVILTVILTTFASTLNNSVI